MMLMDGGKDSMAIKILCIQNGVPLWSSAYPERENDQNSLISGFLSAINTFAKVMEGKIIKNMTIGDSLWTFVNVHGMDDFFITSEIDIMGEKEAKNYKIKLINSLVSEILDEFTKLFPKDFFETNFRNLSAYSSIQAFATKRIMAYYEILERYEKHDVKWLADFGGSEKLFTATMENEPIFVTGKNLEKACPSDDLTKLQATIEFVSGHPIERGYISDSELQNKGTGLSNGLYCMSLGSLGQIIDKSYAIVDLDAKLIINGPTPNSTAIRVVDLLRNYSPGSRQSIDVSAPFSADEKEIADLTRLISDKQPLQTEVKCKLCGELIRFNIDDATSYLNKKAHQTFFGMDLVTYRIAHLSSNQMHVNSVLVDNKGFVHGLIEAYAIPLDEQPKKNDGTSVPELTRISDNEQPLRQHQVLETSFLFNMKNLTFIELICPISIKSMEIGKIILEKMQEILLIYTTPPEVTSVTVADKKYDVWISGPKMIATNFRKRDQFEIFDLLFKKVLDLNYNEKEWLSKRERLNLMLRFVETTKISKQDVPIMLRILSDDLIYTSIQLKYPDQIPRIVDRISKEFLIAKDVLEPLLTGKITIIELFRKGYLNRTREMIQLVDFINRRNILA